MKLIVAGAKGFVASEVIRQSLSNAHITSVIALARGAVAVPTTLGPGTDVSKLHSVTIEDYGSYSDEVKQHFADADACIWTVAITPSKARKTSFEEVRRICNEVAVTGLTAMVEARKGASGGDGGGEKTPFRFMFMSGASAERDQSKRPSWMPEYCLMRGEGESQLLAFAAKHPDVEVCVARPGLIIGPGQHFMYMAGMVMGWLGIVPSINVDAVAVAMLDQVSMGFEKEPLQNDDLIRIGKRVLQQRENR